MHRLVTWALVALAPAIADDRVRQMTDRLSEEAAAFTRVAPLILAHETLKQTVVKPPGRFHPRIGAAATKPPEPKLQTRTIVSEYGFSALSDSPNAIHELREVISVDGKPVKDASKAVESLAAGITSNDDARKKQMLKALEKYGLRGGATDFGQLILLFDRRQIMHYEFSFLGKATVFSQPALAFSFRQIDGPDVITIIDAEKDSQVLHFRAEGQLWVRESDLRPQRILLVVTRGDAKEAVQDEATVDYDMSPWGALLPWKVHHQERRAGKVMAENHFEYSDYRKFSASTDIKFTTEPPGKR